MRQGTGVIYSAYVHIHAHIHTHTHTYLHHPHPGGSTAASVLHALAGPRVILHVSGQVEEAVPMLTLGGGHGDWWNGLPVVTKAGALG